MDLTNLMKEVKTLQIYENGFYNKQTVEENLNVESPVERVMEDGEDLDQ